MKIGQSYILFHHFDVKVTDESLLTETIVWANSSFVPTNIYSDC